MTLWDSVLVRKVPLLTFVLARHCFAFSAMLFFRKYLFLSYFLFEHPRLRADRSSQRARRLGSASSGRAARVRRFGPAACRCTVATRPRGIGTGKSLIATASFSIIFIKVSDTRGHVVTRLAAIARSTYVDIRPVAQVVSSTSHGQRRCCSAPPLCIVSLLSRDTHTPTIEGWSRIVILTSVATASYTPGFPGRSQPYPLGSVVPA